MGSNVAPTFANIFMHWYETRNIYNLFFLWHGPDEDLITFVDDSKNGTVMFKVHRDPCKINFLDVTVYKDTELQQLHTNFLERNTLLHYSSRHTQHLLNYLPRCYEWSR
ncbi:hypothetical protein XELAEV_18006908mg [Xenopus laevis]|uniref:Uncharacterized protein n=1 Tax=Xenopus laevis TaxID=8355 RepID=A0A974E202_XENLA|nr:hypothetical protein XELAEV_18006908mg [Xenopus laevis]